MKAISVVRVLMCLGLLFASGAWIGPAAAGTPGVSSANPEDLIAIGAFAAVTPQRVMDTRHGLGASTPGAFGTVTLPLNGRAGLPHLDWYTGRAVLHVTVTNAKGNGFLTEWGNDGRPNTSFLNFSAGQTISNTLIAQIATDDTIHLYNGSGGPVDIVIDVVGYYQGASSRHLDGAFWATNSSRLIDTRLTPARGVAAGETLTESTSAWSNNYVGRFPAASLMINVTVTGATGPGYLTAWGDGPAPTASTVNFARGQTVSNLTVVPIGQDGAIRVRNSSGGTVQIVIDVYGYFQAGPPRTWGEFGQTAPTRLLDTRQGSGTGMPAGTDVAVPVVGKAGIPADQVAAAVVNLTVTAPQGPGHLISWGPGIRPETSSLNFAAGQTIAGTVVAPLDEHGAFHVSNRSGGSIQLVVDVVGYVEGPGPARAGVPGTVSGVGYNSAGQLGSDRFQDHNEGTRVPGLTGVVKVVGGTNDAYALKANGTVWAWGDGGGGTLGNGTEPGQPTLSPVQVSIDHVIDIGASLQTAFAVKSDGSVWAWGLGGALGGLGDGGKEAYTTVPVQVSKISHAVAVVGASSSGGVALLSDGSVWAWGLNAPYADANGEHGRLTPIHINVSGVTAITAHPRGGYALRADGSVWTWSYVSDLGTETSQVTGLPPVIAVSGNNFATYALTAAGSVYGWGDGSIGELGTGNPSSGIWPASPMLIPGVNGATAIAAGGSAGYALLANGSAVSWGRQPYLGHTWPDDGTVEQVQGVGAAASIAASVFDFYVVDR